MKNTPLTIHSLPHAMIHADADAFFASCEQSRNPKLQGKPVIIGKERGIVASLSYEAKALGVVRGMRLFEAKKICPDIVMLPSDYETYSLLSKRFFSIVRRYTPEVEEFSIDECFADITGMRRPLRMSYQQIAEKIKHVLDTELGFSFSLGLGPNKTIAKIASKWKKPSGLTIIPGKKIHLYLKNLGVGKVCGIGRQTAAYLEKLGVRTTLELAKKDEAWVKRHFTKPTYEIWQELNGKYVLKLETQEKTNYASIQKMKTFSPPSEKVEFLLSHLSKNIENACIKARRYGLAARGASFLLRTQNFQDVSVEVRFSRPMAIPGEIIKRLEENFSQIYQAGTLYRSTGVTLFDLVEDRDDQLDLFGEVLRFEEMKKLYRGVDETNKRFGKHTVHLGASHLAQIMAQHAGERGDFSQRKKELFKGETKRQRLGIPMLLSRS